MSRRKRQGTDHVDPDLPITPMLDMSFQLLAFFIMTFNPTPTEGQIAMGLPHLEGGGQANPDITVEKPRKWTVTVLAADDGKIAKMYLRDEDVPRSDPDDKGEDIGAAPATFLERVQRVAAAERKRRDDAPADRKPPPPKLTLELADDLHQGSLVQLMDCAVQAGFTDIAPVPIAKKK